MAGKTQAEELAELYERYVQRLYADPSEDNVWAVVQEIADFYFDETQMPQWVEFPRGYLRLTETARNAVRSTLIQVMNEPFWNLYATTIPTPEDIAEAERVAPFSKRHTNFNDAIAGEGVDDWHYIRMSHEFALADVTANVFNPVIVRCAPALMLNPGSPYEHIGRFLKPVNSEIAADRNQARGNNRTDRPSPYTNLVHLQRQISEDALDNMINISTIIVASLLQKRPTQLLEYINKTVTLQPLLSMSFAKAGQCSK